MRASKDRGRMQLEVGPSMDAREESGVVYPYAPSNREDAQVETDGPKTDGVGRKRQESGGDVTVFELQTTSTKGS